MAYGTFQPAGGTKLALTDSSKAEEDFLEISDNSPGHAVQTALLLRALQPTTYDRGNVVSRFQLSSVQGFAKLEDGWTQYVALRAGVRCTGNPPNGTFTLTIRNYDGSTKAFQIEKAQCHVRIKTILGSAMVYEFIIEGGEFTAVEED